MSGPEVHGVAAEFTTPEALTEAVKAARRKGYTHVDAFTPYPLREVAECLGVRTTVIPWIATLAGLSGAVIQYAAQYWMNVVDYPINVGGRPLHSWPAYIPSPLIVAVLWAGVATLLGLLLILRLPRLHHPVFELRNFERVSEDRFFLCIWSSDPLFDSTGTQAFLVTLAPAAVQEVPLCDGS